MDQTVAIIYGFTEGQWHGKRLRKLLRSQGYRLIKRPERADVVIAHSGGCFDVPQLQDHTLLVLIDPPYWPERELFTRAHHMSLQMLRAIRPGNRPLFHLSKTLHNFMYLVRHARTNRRLVYRSKTFDLEREVTHLRTILVRNANDPWLTPHLDKLLELNPHLEVARMPGDHDDCWQHPEPYLNLIQAYRD